MPAVYVASPLGYTLAGRIFHRRTLVPALEANDLTVLDPWADEDGRVAEAIGHHGAAGGAAYAALQPWLAERNLELLRSAAAVLAVLDGAGGAGPDPGVAAEVGLACGLGIPVVAWRSDIRPSGPDGRSLPPVLERLIEAGGGLHAGLGDAVAAVAALTRRADPPG
jgi:nucleoside 2-deoxyribosyltransferase